MGKRSWLGVAALAAVLTCVSSGFCQASPDELARRHFESGAAYFEQAEYDSALREFSKAYELSQRPEILLNIATVQERLGNLSAAIAALDEYLKLQQDTEAASTVRLRRDNLQKRLDAQAAPPPPPPPPPNEPETPPPPVSEQEPEGPNYVPSYVLFSVAGVSAAGAVLTGIFAQGEYNDLEKSCSPNCSDGEIANAQTLATLSTVLTGAAVVSAALGVVFYFGAGDGKSDSAVRKPNLSAGVHMTPAGPMARAKWVF